MTRITSICCFGMISLLMQGCTEEALNSYSESKLVSYTESWLLDNCHPDTWCEPYAESVSESCVARLFDPESLYTLPNAALEEALQETLMDMRACAYVEASDLHKQTLE